MTKAGNVTSIIGMVFSIIMMIIWLVYIILIIWVIANGSTVMHNADYNLDLDEIFNGLNNLDI